MPHPKKSKTGEATPGTGTNGEAARPAPRTATRRELQLEVVARLGLYALREPDLQAFLAEATAQTARTLGVEYCKVLELQPGEDGFLLRAAYGWEERLVGHLRVPADPATHVGYTLHTSEPVAVEDLATETRFPGSPLLHERTVASGLTVLIVGRDRPYGVFAVHTTTRRRFSEDDLFFIQSVANLVGEAVARIRAEEALRAREETLRSLNEATMLLAASLDYEQTLSNVAGLMVPTFADWCAIDLLAEDGSLRRVAVAHPDPERLALAHELGRRYPPDPAYARWLELNEPQLVPEVTDEMLGQLARDAEHLRIVRELGLRSSVVVPLVARGHTLGAITLIHAESGRRYGAADLPPLVELARSCALAVDNARLLDEAQREVAERRRAEAEIERLNRDLKHRLDELQTLLDVSPVGLAVAHDPTCRTITANPAFAAMLGLAPGRNVSKTGPEADGLPFRVRYQGREVAPEALPMQTAAARDVEIRAQEYEIVRADGEVLTLLEYASPLHDEAGRVRGAMGAFVDITAIKRTEQALRQSENRLRQLADAMPQLVLILSPENRLTFVNEQWRAYTGLSLEQGDDPSEIARLVHPDDLPHLVRRWREAAAQGSIFEFEYRLRRAADGAFRWFLARLVPVQDEDGRLLEWVGTATDIDAQKQAEAALREESHTLETINRVNATLAAELDLGPLVQAVTDAGTELTGAEFGAFFYNVVDDQGESYMLYALSGAPPEAFSRFPMPRNTAIFGPTFHGEAIVRLDDVTQDPRYGQNPPFQGMPEGHLPVRSYLAAPVVSRAGDVLGGLFFGHSQAGVFTERAERLIASICDQAAIAIENARLYHAAQRELAERTRAEQQLKDLNETLEERVEERTEALARTNDRLQAEVAERTRAEQALERTNAALLQSNRELQEFAYVASHDLQEPLRKISSFADLLRLEYGPAFDDNGRLYLGRMQDAALRMSSLITDLLSYSRVATRGQPFVETDLNAVVADVLSDLEVRLEEAGGTVEVAPLPTIEADPTQMRQLFQNLLSNALKFHKPGVPPVVRVAAEVRVERPVPGAPAQPACRVTVEDNGIGFDEKYLDRIFSPFQRLHGRSTYEGTGIGLAICRRIVERHHGTLTARSRPGNGATFVVTLPVKQAEQRG